MSMTASNGFYHQSITRCPGNPLFPWKPILVQCVGIEFHVEKIDELRSTIFIIDGAN